MTITIGTTPTIIFNNFQVVRVGEIKEAVLTIKQGGMYSRAVLFYTNSGSGTFIKGEDV